jgi:S-adenosylmethionine-diacylgycerolhomoserine-N-methlytransferase
MSELTFTSQLSSHLRFLYGILFNPIHGSTQKARLESFYKVQAPIYDVSREKLLRGRSELCDQLKSMGAVQGNWLDIGAGTGWNLSLLEREAHSCKEITLLDLSSALLTKAKERVEKLGLQNVQFIHEDILEFPQQQSKYDLITFSYSLTMIPNWFLVLQKATELLNPGGIIAVTDFYISRKYSLNAERKHHWFTRTFLPIFFSFDDVNLSPDHLPYLKNHFSPLVVQESLAPLPYTRIIKAPYYVFIGRKK